ncbi:MAG TPA: class I SAM-dependent methyltransferase [Acidobacteriaceae bacterium]|jgi:ubiquinone/menaquinone biosynthesis C-methylase UbiE|nr:class I SAM-dependent methyltransferase [Acidobacteriaceae bacterium]
MRAPTKRFDGRAEAYARFRERYDPAIVLPRLRAWCGLTPEWLVADVGAGTGMLSEVFLANGNRVIAIEPNAEMRAACERELGEETRLEVREGTAEATELESASVEMVSVGRALHWFDVERAMAEFRRVLKPKGWFVSVACGHDEKGSPQNEELTALFRSQMPAGTMKQVRDAYDRLPEHFAGGEYRQEEIGGEMQVGWEELHGLAISMSVAPLEDAERLAEFERALRRLFERYESGGVVSFGTRYWINAGRFGEQESS